MTIPALDRSLQRIVLPERLDYAACPELFDQLTAAGGQSLRLDAGAVDFLGGLAAELLIRAALGHRAAGHAVELADPSDGFLRGLARLGLTLSDVSTGGSR